MEKAKAVRRLREREKPEEEDDAAANRSVQVEETLARKKGAEVGSGGGED